MADQRINLVKPSLNDDSGMSNHHNSYELPHTIHGRGDSGKARQ